MTERITSMIRDSWPPFVIRASIRTRLLIAFLLVALLPFVVFVVFVAFVAPFAAPFVPPFVAPFVAAFVPPFAAPFVAAFVAAFVAPFVAAFMVTRSIARPLSNMAEAAKQIATGHPVHIPELKRKDEIGTLVETFNTTVGQLHDLIGSLEQRVAERTRALQEANYALQRRAVQLETSAEVARAITSIFDVDLLLHKTMELIRDRFGFYHAGIFLLDQTGEWAVLREATGEAGAQMKAEGHRLAVAETSMVGWTALHRQPRLALDVGQDAIRFANPLLPYTHSEMTLPMLVGDRLLGVLNVQSTEIAAFDEDDTRVLQSMANQIAVAIENARKVSDEALLLEAASPMYRASRRLGQATTIGEVADSIIASVTETGADGCNVVEFEFSPAGEPDILVYRGVWRRDREGEIHSGTRLPATASPIPVHMACSLWMVPDLTQDNQLPPAAQRAFEAIGMRALANIPLRLRDTCIGHIVVMRATAGPFSANWMRLYETLSDQAAVALERAQLWDLAQRRAKQEQQARLMIDRIRRSTDVEQALHTTAEELSQALSVPHVSIELRLEAPPSPRKGEGRGEGPPYAGQSDGIAEPQLSPTGEER